jgi:hypothetical protein
LKDKGYKIRLCVHPNLLAQLVDFEENEILEIVKDPAHLAHFNLLIQDLSAMARAMFNTKNKIDRQ